MFIPSFKIYTCTIHTKEVPARCKCINHIVLLRNNDNGDFFRSCIGQLSFPSDPLALLMSGYDLMHIVLLGTAACSPWC